MENYKTLDIKYRPETVHDLIGQPSIVAKLEAMFATKRMSRSFFLSGPYGTGKTTSSRIIAKYAVCLEPTSDGVPCGSCTSCKMFKTKTASHPDIEEINGSDHRKIDDMRKLIKRLNFAPMVGRFKVFIIDECHKLTPDAFTAILVAYENPPPRCVLILSTSEPTKVPGALRSRGIILDTELVSVENTVKYLRSIVIGELGKKSGLKKIHLKKIAESSDGHVRNAVKTLESILNVIMHEGKAVKDMSAYLEKAVETLSPKSLNAVIYSALLALYLQDYTRVLFVLKQLDHSASYFMEQVIKHHIQAMYYFGEEILKSNTNKPVRYRLTDSRYKTWYKHLERDVAIPIDSDIMAYMLDSFVEYFNKMKGYLINEDYLLINAFLRNFNYLNSFEEDEPNE